MTFKLGLSIADPEIDRSGEFFADLADHTYNHLIEHIEPDTAQAIVNSLLAELSKTFAGEKIYITRKPAIFARWMQAYNDLRYMHYLDVDRKYGWSDGYSLRIQDKISKMRKHRQQLRLPLL